MAMPAVMARSGLPPADFERILERIAPLSANALARALQVPPMVIEVWDEAARMGADKLETLMEFVFGISQDEYQFIRDLRLIPHDRRRAALAQLESLIAEYGRHP